MRKRNIFFCVLIYQVLFEVVEYYIEPLFCRYFLEDNTSRIELRMYTAKLIMTLSLFLIMRYTNGQPADTIHLFVILLITLVDCELKLIAIINYFESFTC